MQSISEDMIDAAIQKCIFHHFPGTQVVVCCITLKNGFSVIGTANAHNPSAFDISQGCAIAQEQARDKIAPFLSYAIRERLNRAKMPELNAKEITGTEFGEVRTLRNIPDDDGPSFTD